MLQVYADGGLVQPGMGQQIGAYWSVGIEDERGFRIVRRQRRDPSYRTSGEAEVAALLDALSLLPGLPHPHEVRLYSDCRSLVDSLREHRPLGKRRMRRIHLQLLALWDHLSSLGLRLSIAWVPRTVMEQRLGH